MTPNFVTGNYELPMSRDEITKQAAINNKDKSCFDPNQSLLVTKLRVPTQTSSRRETIGDIKEAAADASPPSNTKKSSAERQS